MASFASALCLVACFDPDPREIDGAIEAAALAVEDDDSARLFSLLDVRARHAMGGIVDAHQKARALIESDYPAGERSAALARLGPAVDSPSALFAQRCDAACRAEIGQKLGAPERIERDGKSVTVHTVRGTTLDMYAGEQWFGIVWNTTALMAERDRAARELKLIEENAATYRRRAALSAGAAADTLDGQGAGKPADGSAR